MIVDFGGAACGLGNGFFDGGFNLRLEVFRDDGIGGFYIGTIAWGEGKMAFRTLDYFGQEGCVASHRLAAGRAFKFDVRHNNPLMGTYILRTHKR